MAVDHYENFPVASLLLPARLRQPVRDIYRYARSADDIADEGGDDAETRLRKLRAYRRALQDIGTGTLALAGDDPLAAVFVPLARSIKQYQLPLQCFFDLISAFEQDVRLHRYEIDVQLLDYCSRSANPVGRLMLHLYRAVSPENLREADALCTGLQLVNFWQDVAVDWAKGRVYLPREKLRRHGVDEAQIARGDTGPAWRQLMHAQAAQAREMLLAGMPLARRLPGRIGLELRMVAHGGLRILERLERIHYDVFRHRPTLRKSDWMLLLWRALR
jgi:phytoene synthase